MLKINPIFHEETSVSELRNHANNAMNKIIVIDDNTYLITGCNSTLTALTLKVNYKFKRVGIEGEPTPGKPVMIEPTDPIENRCEILDLSEKNINII